MTTSTSSLTREELEEAIDRMRVVTGAIQIAVKTLIDAFGPVAEQLKERFEETAKTYPWLLELPPDEQAEYDALEDDFEMRDPHPYEHGWNSQDDPAQGKCNVCGKPQDDVLHEGPLAEVEEFLGEQTGLEERVVDPKLDGLPCVDCGCTQQQHPNSTCDAFSCEVSPNGVAHEHYWSKQVLFDEKTGRSYRKCNRMSCAPDPARKYGDFGTIR